MQDNNFPKIYSYAEMVSRSISFGHYFLLFNCALSIFIGTAYTFSALNNDSFISFIYLILTNIGHMSFLTFIVFLIVLFPLAFIGNFRYYRIISVIIMCIYHMLLLIDAKLYLYVKAHLSLGVLNIVISDLDFDTGLNYNFLFVALPIIIALVIFFAKLATKSLYRFKIKKYAFISAILITSSFITSHLIHIWADADNYDEITALRSTYPIHYPMTARSFLRSHGFIAQNKTLNDDVQKVKYPLNSLKLNQNITSFNVLHIMLENISYQDLLEPKPQLTKISAMMQNFESFYMPYTSSLDNLFASGYGLPILYRKTILQENITPIVVEAMQKLEYGKKLFLVKDKYDFEQKLSNSPSFVQINTSTNDIQSLDKLKLDLQNFDSSRKFAFYAILSDLNSVKNNNDYQNKLTNLENKILDIILQLKAIDCYDNTLIIISSISGNNKYDDNKLKFKRNLQQGVLLIKWPFANAIASSNNALASSFDLSPTIAFNALGVINKSTDFSVGNDLKNANFDEKQMLIIDGNDLIIANKSFATIYTNDGGFIVENTQGSYRAIPKLETLIRAMRDLNRFKE